VIKYLSKKEYINMEKYGVLLLSTIIMFFMVYSFQVTAINCACCPAPQPPNITWSNCTLNYGCGATNIYPGGDDYCVYANQPPCNPILCPTINYTTGCIYMNASIPEGEYYSTCNNPVEIQYHNCFGSNFVLGNTYNCGYGQTCVQINNISATCQATSTTAPPVYNITWDSSTPIAPINQTQWVLNGWGWVLPFFTPIFMLTSATGFISGIAGKFGGMAIGGIVALMLTLIFTIIGVYPAWLGIVVIIIGGFILVNMVTKTTNIKS